MIGLIGPTPRFQSTPSVRRATLTGAQLYRVWGISIHALREESDAAAAGRSTSPAEFQSTPSVRRATALNRMSGREFEISIHALREESDATLR